MKHVNPFKHTTAEDYEHFLSYMWASGARHNALLCKAYFDGADAPHEEYEAYMAAHPEQAEQEPVAWMQIGIGDCEGTTILTARLPIEYNTEWWKFEPLYAAPVKQVDLTDDEIMLAVGWNDTTNNQIVDIGRAVIAKFKEKNK